MSEKELADSLRVGDEITTILNRNFKVGSVHWDGKWSGRYWIEPQGAGEFDWWIPVSNIIRVNGKEVQISSPINSSNSQT
jgi:hypothetical protein